MKQSDIQIWEVGVIYVNGLIANCCYTWLKYTLYLFQAAL